MQRGELCWTNFPPPTGLRPALLLMRDSAYSYRASVTVAPVTRRIRDIASEVKIGPEEGLDQPSVVNLDDIITLSKARIRNKIGFLSEAKMQLVEEAIRYCLALPPYRARF